MTTKINGTNLDWQAQEVLEAIVEAGGEASTSDVKAYTGIENNEIIKYRFGKLSQAGLIDTHQPSSRNGRPAAKVAQLTNEAERLLGDDGYGLDFEVEPGDDELTLDERVLRLEKQVGKMRETYGEVKERIVSIEDDLEEYDEDLNNVAEDVENLKRFLVEKDF